VIIFTQERAIAFLEKELAKQYDEKDKESVQARLKNLRALDNNIRKAITDGKLDAVTSTVYPCARRVPAFLQGF
jgi:hypothetical protein